MIDIETLSSDDNAAVISIGACMFNMRGETGDEFLIAVDIEDAMRHGKASGDTIGWWMRQDESAWGHLFSGSPVTSEYAVEAFTLWLQLRKPEFVWAKPPQFDIVILRNLFKRHMFKWPCHYRSERDLRTLMAVYNGTYPEAITNDAKHDPLADAVHQARVAAHCWQWIRGTR
jgi:hypothetical protein